MYATWKDVVENGVFSVFGTSVRNAAKFTDCSGTSKLLTVNNKQTQLNVIQQILVTSL